MNLSARLVAGVLACSFLGLAACGGDTNVLPAPAEPESNVTFSHAKMADVTFHHFLKTDDGLYAATSAGVFQLKDEQWDNLTAAEQWQVYDLEAVGAGHYLASVMQDDNFYLAESLDSGATWSFIDSNFGQIEEGGTVVTQLAALGEKIQALEYDSAMGMLYGTGYNVLAGSADYGRNWQILTGEWQGFARGYSALTVAPDSLKIWFGGQNAIEESKLLSFNVATLETRTHDSMTDMTSEPGTIQNIRFHPDNPDVIFAAGEPGIISSQDAGETWQAFYLNDASRFYFGLLIHPQQPDTMYTSGWNKAFFDPQPFYLEYTKDGGTTWQKIKYTDDESIFGGVWSMYADYGQAESTLYFGLYKGGVMQVTVKH